MKRGIDSKYRFFISVTLILGILSFISEDANGLLSVSGWFPVGMVYFFMLSFAAGVVFSKERELGFSVFLIKRIKKYIFSTIAAALVFAVLQKILSGILGTSIGVRTPGFGTMLWFLVTMFLAEMLLSLIYRICNRDILCLIISVAIGMITYFIVRKFSLYEFSFLEWFFRPFILLPFVALGSSYEFIVSKIKNKSIVLFAASFIIQFAVFHGKESIFFNIGKLKSLSDINMIRFYGMGIASILFWMAASEAVDRYVDNMGKITETIFRYRYYIYIFGLFAVWNIKGMIISLMIVFRKEGYELKAFFTDIYYSYLPSERYILIYLVGTIVFLLVISFVLSSIASLLRPKIKKLLDSIGVRTDEFTEEKACRLIFAITAFIVLVAGIILGVSTIWLFRTWANLNIYELVYTVTAPIAGTNSGMIRDYIIKYGLIEFGFIVVAIVVLIAFRKKKRGEKILQIIYLFLGIALITSSCVYANNRLGIIKYIKNMNGDISFIKDLYVDPASAKLTFPEKKRNLIYIYLESFEMTYADEEVGGAFSSNVLPRLTELAEEGETFSGDPKKLNGGISLDGTTWTMGAIFGQSSGIPMLINMSSSAFETQDNFCEGITTIGDILEDNGYKNVYMIGSSATFGGREVFYRTHGNYEIYDYDYAIKQGWIPADYKVWWGFEDKKLFEFAKNKITELASGDQPFNFTMLTVDTHFEDGYVCDLCDEEFGSNQYANVFHCSDKQVSEFVEWAKGQDWYEDTVIVLCGDHPTMDSDFCEAVPSSYKRKVYTNIINATPKYEGEEREYTTLDLFPTTLAAMGIEIKGNRLAWGTNLFSDNATLAEMYGSSALNEEFQKGKKYIDELANFEITDDLLNKVRGRFKLVKKNLDNGEVELTVNIGEMIHGSFVDHYEIEYSDGGEIVRLESIKTEKDSETIHSFRINKTEISYGGSAKVYIVVSGERYFMADIDSFSELVK